MKSIEVTENRNALGSSVRLLRTMGKRPGVVKSLPKASYVRPEVVVDADHLAAYARLCGFTPEQGVPLIYPQMLTFPLMMEYMASPACPWPAMGTVHLANAIEQEEALRIGETVRVELASGELFAHDKGQVFTLEFRILRGKQVIWRATQTLLRIGVKNPQGKPYVSALNDGPELSRQADLNASADIGRRYAKVSGDFNPIHLSAVSAKLMGFRRAIAHGMWTKARALALILPAQQVEQASALVEFKTPLLLPARPSLWTRRGAADAVFEVRDNKGEKPHLRGRLSF